MCVPGSVYACCCSSSVHVCSKCDEERRTRIAFVHDMLPTRLTPSGVELSNIQVRTLKLLQTLRLWFHEQYENINKIYLIIAQGHPYRIKHRLETAKSPLKRSTKPVFSTIQTSMFLFYQPNLYLLIYPQLPQLSSNLFKLSIPFNLIPQKILHLSSLCKNTLPMITRKLF